MNIWCQAIVQSEAWCPSWQYANGHPWALSCTLFCKPFARRPQPVSSCADIFFSYVANVNGRKDVWFFLATAFLESNRCKIKVCFRVLYKHMKEGRFLRNFCITLSGTGNFHVYSHSKLHFSSVDNFAFVNISKLPSIKLFLGASLRPSLVQILSSHLPPLFFFSPFPKVQLFYWQVQV